MLIFLYLAALITVLYWVSKTLLPEMTKPSPQKTVEKLDPFDLFGSDGPDKKTEKLEAILAEKNRNIDLLQKELKTFYAQVRSFDKVKTLMDEEIQRLREQNRIFRSELGLPAIHTKENSIT